MRLEYEAQFCVLTMFSRQYNIYCIRYRNEASTASVCDVDDYAIIRKLLSSVFNIIPIFTPGQKIQTYLTGFPFRNFAYAMFDVTWFLE